MPNKIILAINFTLRERAKSVRSTNIDKFLHAHINGIGDTSGLRESAGVRLTQMREHWQVREKRTVSEK